MSNRRLVNINKSAIMSKPEEQGKGSVDKHKYLKQLHQRLEPSLYLEIGVQKGKSLKLAECERIGIDPEPLIVCNDVYKCASDNFFKNKAPSILNRKRPDLIFIDGMHLFEYALRDFINCEKYSKKSTVIVMDDIFPAHPKQALRERKTSKWTGDVWKMVYILKEYRQDLELDFIDASPTGLLIIKNLDRYSTILEDNYNQIFNRYLNINNVPKEIINREFLN